MENIINILKESKELLNSKDLEELKEKLLTAYWEKQYAKMELDFNYVRSSVNDELEKIRQGG